MSLNINENQEFINEYNNADLAVARDANDVAVAYTKFKEMEAYKLYLETLKLEADISKSKDTINVDVKKADGTIKTVALILQDLMPPADEFEQMRRYVISKLHGKTPQELKKYMADFDTESTYELSSKITNHLLDKQRRSAVENDFVV